MAFSIGPFSFDGRAWLAPLAAVTSAPYRQICLEHGCGQAVTEMVSSEALIRDVAKIGRRMVRAHGERFLIVQLFGGKPESMARAATLAVERVGADIIDVNMGCPVKKVLGAGAGVALMREPDRAAAIVHAIVEAVGPTVPVTVKMRAGWEGEVNALEVAERVVDAGAAAIALHARTREQFHRGDTCWDVIATLKQRLPVPVIGNGGVRGADEARAMQDQTGCDAVMVGRAAMGNPWVFASLAKGEAVEPTMEERFRVIRQHIEGYAAFAGEAATAREMRKHLCWYLRGLVGSSMVRAQLQSMRTVSDLLDILQTYEDLLARGDARASPRDFGAALTHADRYGAPE